MGDPNNIVFDLRPRPPGSLQTTLEFVRGRVRHPRTRSLLEAVHERLRPGVELGGPDQLVISTIFIGAIPFDGATTTYELLMADGCAIWSWIGEDYGHRTLEVTLRAPDHVGIRRLEEVACAIFEAAGHPRDRSSEYLES